MNVYSIVKEPEVLASLLIGEFFAIRTASNFKKIKIHRSRMENDGRIFNNLLNTKRLKINESIEK